MTPERKVVVAGAGTAGLCTAHALVRAGIPVTVFERSPELQAFGGGITIWFNGMAALDRLGLAAELEAVGERMEFQEMRTSRGRLLFEIPIGELTSANGLRPPLVVRRPDLVRTLAADLGEGVLHTGVACVAFEQDTDGVTVRLSDGTSERASVLVAADGIDSEIRAALFPETQPRHAGYQYLRALIDYEDPRIEPGKFVFTFGQGDRFGINACDGWTYWFAVIAVPPGTGDSELGRKGDLLQRFRDFPAPITDYIEAAPDESIGRVDIRDLDPMSSWVNGRVTLLGDAAHAVTPNLARGAGEAVEDAVALARALAAAGTLESGRDVESALQAFDAERRPKTTKAQKAARRIGKLASWRNPVACAVRNELMHRVGGKAIVKQMSAEAAELGAAKADDVAMAARPTVQPPS